MPNPTFLGQPLSCVLCNSGGHALIIPSALISGYIAVPIAVCFCDPSGHEWSVTGSTPDQAENEIEMPRPVVLCNFNGNPLVGPTSLTSNGHTVIISAVSTGIQVGSPLSVCLTDANGVPLTLTGEVDLTFGSDPQAIILCDVSGHPITFSAV
jgi:hypothetical protein